jgi:hypothetical protein
VWSFPWDAATFVQTNRGTRLHSTWSKLLTSLWVPEFPAALEHTLKRYAYWYIYSLLVTFIFPVVNAKPFFLQLIYTKAEARISCLLTFLCINSSICVFLMINDTNRYNIPVLTN